MLTHSETAVKPALNRSPVDLALEMVGIAPSLRMLTYSETAVKPALNKALGDIAREWDGVAPIRQRQLAAGQDMSFKYVLLPALRELLAGGDLRRVVDLGCGVGELTRELAAVSGQVVGVDAAPGSVALAQERGAGVGNLAFHTADVAEFARSWPGPPFTAAIANMSLMSCLDLDSFVPAAAALLGRGGCFAATITHPWFWPYYWGYAAADWFRYDRELVLEGPFRISGQATDCITTHVHRPLSAYLDALTRAGFVLDHILEPYPEEPVQALYPERWQFPRFLAFRAIKVSGKGGIPLR